MRLSFAVDLRPPPAHSDKQESPVSEKLRWLAFEGVADKLEDPPEDKQRQRVEPKTMNENTRDENRDRKQKGRNAQSVACPVHGMLVARGVLRDPLLVGTST